MSKTISFRALALGSVAAAAMSFGAHAQDAADELDFTLLDSFCVECHNFEEWAGGVAFDTMDPAAVHDDAEIWEEALRKLHGGLMPPPGAEQPAPEQLDAFILDMETRLDAAAAKAGPRPGYVTLHRLNRAEYANEIRKLFDLDINVADMLPADAESDGFNNVANVLSVDPTFLDQYIGAAREISIAAVGNGEQLIDQATYIAPRMTNNNVHLEGLPLGSRGGMQVQHYFPADGEYRISIGLSSFDGELLRAYPTGWLEYEHTVVFSIDGKPVFEANIGGNKDRRAVDQEQQPAVDRIQQRFQELPFQLESGTHTLTAAFVSRGFTQSDDVLENFIPAIGFDDVPVIKMLDVIGPITSTGPGNTPSRQKIFSCYPDAAAEQRDCARDILARLGAEAWRRPLETAELDRLLGFYDEGVAEKGFETGVQKSLMAMLASTNFLYRVEHTPAGLAEGDVYDLGDQELASRLAFFLWSQGPDAELSGIAARGGLSDPETLRAQAARMLADPRAEALVENFAFQWLGVDKLDQIMPDPRVFPYFDDDLRKSMGAEMHMFLDEVLLDGGGSVMDLLNADYTYVNERLALHYGIPNVQGSNFRRVTLDDSSRWGVLGKGALLTGTSYPNRTSPVLRGAWVLETLMGSPPSAPPPGVETNLDSVPGGSSLTVRARLEQHRADPSCNSCHGVIDPVGMSLENFDAVGMWREIDRFAGERIDATGVLAGTGQPVTGPDDLRAALEAHPERFVQAFTEKLMTYALGRRVEYFDMPVVRRIVDETADDNYAFASIVQEIVVSDPFRMKAVPTAEDLRHDEAEDVVEEASLAQPANLQ